jgi:hypothetical protein
VDFSGSVKLVGDLDRAAGLSTVGKFRASLDNNLTGSRQESGSLERVYEGKTHGSGEGNGDLILVVQLGVVEVLSATERGSSHTKD